MDYGFLTLVAPLLTLAIAIATRKVPLAMLIGIFTGQLIICGWNPFTAINEGLNCILGVCTDTGNLKTFLFTALIMWAMEKVPGNRTVVMIISMVLGLLACYAFGTVWFVVVYAQKTGPVGLWTALGWCVFPYIIPDLVKIALALVLQKRLRAAIRLA